MPGVLTWKQVGKLRARGCSLCGWVSPEPAEDSGPPLTRADALKRIKTAFKAHHCKDYPNDSAGCQDDDEDEDGAAKEDQGHACLVSPPLDRTVLGTDSGYWQVRVVSAHRTPQENLLLTLNLKRDVDGERVEVRTLCLRLSLSHMAEPRWQSHLSAKVRTWIESSCGSGYLKIDSLME